MIFLDTNIILRFLTDPGDETTRRMHQMAVQLFDDVRAGRVDVTTSEVVLHEACFVLQSSRHYGYSVDQIIPVSRR